METFIPNLNPLAFLLKAHTADPSKLAKTVISLTIKLEFGRNFF